MGSLRGTPNRFAQRVGLLNIGKICTNTAEYALCNAYVKGYTQYQTSLDTSLCILGSGNHILLHTRHFPMVRHNATGDSRTLTVSLRRYSGQLLCPVMHSQLPS